MAMLPFRVGRSCLVGTLFFWTSNLDLTVLYIMIFPLAIVHTLEKFSHAPCTL